MYYLSGDGCRSEGVRFSDVGGFFVVEGGGVDAELTLIGVSSCRSRRRDLVDAQLWVVDGDGKQVGEYYVGDVKLPPRLDIAVDSLRLPFRGARCEYAEAREIWARWTDGSPLRPQEWMGRGASYQDAWLHVVQNAWFCSDTEERMPNSSALVDGRIITSESAFWCALGESVFGPGGYMGSNLDALAECLGWHEAVRRITWTDFDWSQQVLGRRAKRILEVLREFEVDLMLEN